MFDEKRYFQNCLFCTSPLSKGTNGTASKEHIFGKAIAKLHPETKHWHSTTTWAASESDPFPETKKGNSPLLNITSKGVCKSCNSEKLGAFQEKAFEFLKAAITGTRFNKSECDPLNTLLYFQRLAMIVDIETSNFQLEDKLRSDPTYSEKFGPTRAMGPLINAEDRRKILDGIPTREISIFLGKNTGFIGKSLECCLIPYTAFNSRIVISKKFIYAIGKLVVILAISDPPVESRENLIELSSSSLAPFDWPPKAKYTYDDFFSNYKQTRIIRWQRFLLRERRWRRVAEKNVLKSDNLGWPPPPNSFV